MSAFQAVLGGVVLARSDETVLVDGYRYFPWDSITEDLLRPTKAKSLCVWKGVASWYDVAVEGRRMPRVAWTYRHPSPLARRIKGHVAFWGDVRIEKL